MMSINNNNINKEKKTKEDNNAKELNEKTKAAQGKKYNEFDFNKPNRLSYSNKFYKNPQASQSFYQFGTINSNKGAPSRSNNIIGFTPKPQRKEDLRFGTSTKVDPSSNVKNITEHRVFNKSVQKENKQPIKAYNTNALHNNTPVVRSQKESNSNRHGNAEHAKPNNHSRNYSTNSYQHYNTNNVKGFSPQYNKLDKGTTKPSNTTNNAVVNNIPQNIGYMQQDYALQSTSEYNANISPYFYPNNYYYYPPAQETYQNTQQNYSMNDLSSYSGNYYAADKNDELKNMQPLIPPIIPSEKKSRAIKIINPNTKEEVVIKKDEKKKSTKEDSDVKDQNEDIIKPVKENNKDIQKSQTEVEKNLEKSPVGEKNTKAKISSKEKSPELIHSEDKDINKEETLQEKKTLSVKDTKSIENKLPLDNPTDIKSDESEALLSPKSKSVKDLEKVNYGADIHNPPDFKSLQKILRYDIKFLFNFESVCTKVPKNMESHLTSTDMLKSESAQDRKGYKNHPISKSSHDYSYKNNSDDRYQQSKNRLSMNQRIPSGGSYGHNSYNRHKKHSVDKSNQKIVHIENRWVPEKLASEKPSDSLELTRKNVKMELNKLTLDNFKTLAQTILDYANKSKNETNGETLQAVIQLIFDKATDEPSFSLVYAKLCLTLLSKIDPEIYDTRTTKDNEYIKGRMLFRRYLLKTCQMKFEKDWDSNTSFKPEDSSNPNQSLSDEYYAAAKHKRRMLGLLKFVGELYKLTMVDNRVVVACVDKILKQGAKNVMDDEAEGLCNFLTTVGEKLDATAKEFTVKLFTSIAEMSTNTNLNSRTRFMLMDLIDLRKKSWKSNKTNTPKTITQIHRDAENEKLKAQSMLKKSASTDKKSSFYSLKQHGRTGSEINLKTHSRTPSTHSASSKLKNDDSERSFKNRYSSYVPNSNVSKIQKDEFSSKNRPSSTLSNKSNNFDLLNAYDEEEKQHPVKSPRKAGHSELLSIDKVKTRLHGMISEYLINKSDQELIENIKDLCPCIGNEPMRVIITSILEYIPDRKSNEQEALINMTALLRNSLMSCDSFMACIDEFYPSIQDIACDCPIMYSIVAGVIHKCTENINESLRCILNKNNIETALEIFLKYITILKDAQEPQIENSDQELILKYFMPSSLGYKRLFTDLQKKKLDDICYVFGIFSQLDKKLSVEAKEDSDNKIVNDLSALIDPVRDNMGLLYMLSSIVAANLTSLKAHKDKHDSYIQKISNVLPKIYKNSKENLQEFTINIFGINKDLETLKKFVSLGMVEGNIINKIQDGNALLSANSNE